MVVGVEWMALTVGEGNGVSEGGAWPGPKISRGRYGSESRESEKLKEIQIVSGWMGEREDDSALAHLHMQIRDEKFTPHAKISLTFIPR